MSEVIGLLSSLVGGEMVAAVTVLVLPFVLIALLYRSFRARRKRRRDESS